MNNDEYNREMVNKIYKIVGYDFFAEPHDFFVKGSERVDNWCEDDRPSPIRLLPPDCRKFIGERTSDLTVLPKSLFDLL